MLGYSTYLGGNYHDETTAVAVDAQGNAYVTGYTLSFDFPATPDAFQQGNASNGPTSQDAFVTKLNADGTAVIYSTYLGGNDYEDNARLALTSTGDVYVGGRTYSPDFPVTQGAFQAQPHSASSGAAEGFVTKLSPTAGAGLLFSTFLGGSGDDFVEGLAASRVDDSVCVTGRTLSTNFPVTPDAYQPSKYLDTSNYDAFVTRLNAAGTQALYSTY